jgi:hypothetical protein
MAAPSYTYTLANSTTADATQVMQDFNDILNGVSDGTKDLNINALTCAGTVTLNGSVTLGNSTTDDVTFAGALESSIPVGTDGLYDIGTTAAGLRYLYLGDGSGDTGRIGVTTLSADRNYTLPDAAGTVVLHSATQTLTAKTFDDAVTHKIVTTPSTPSAGYVAAYVRTPQKLSWVDESGYVHTAVEDGFENYLLNGNFDYFTDETSFAAVADTTYTADQFKYRKVGAVVHTAQSSTDTPTQAESGYYSAQSLLLDCTTADAAIAATDFCSIQTYVEGTWYRGLVGKACTLSFWVKATKTGTYCVAFRNSGADRSYVAEYTVSSSDTWERKTIPITFNQSGGTEAYDTNVGLYIDWVLLAGSNFQGTGGAWQSSDIVATSSQVNAGDSTSNNFRLSQVRLNVGPDQNVFRLAGLNFADEERLLMRYYERSYIRGTANGSSTNSGVRIATRGAGTATITALWSVPKRAIPTVTFYSPNNSGANLVRNAQTSADVTTTSSNESTMSAMGNMSSTSAGDGIAFHFVSNARF